MSKLIDNLIKKYEYNIYINENISGEKLDKLALLLEKEENNTETYFNPLRYKSKFSWFNILYINVVFLYKILIDLYIRIYLSGMVVLGVIILKKRIKDFISGKSR